MTNENNTDNVLKPGDEGYFNPDGYLTHDELQKYNQRRAARTGFYIVAGFTSLFWIVVGSVLFVCC